MFRSSCFKNRSGWRNKSPLFFFFWHMHMFAVAEGLAHLRSGELKPMALMSS